MLLSELPVGVRACVTMLKGEMSLTSRLHKLGIEAGSLVEILHYGFPFNDPIAVRVEDHTIAIGKNEAKSILIKKI